MRALLCFLIFTVPLFAKKVPIDADFEELMGKSTSHWSYVTQAQDKDFLGRVEALYLKNKEAQFTEEGAHKIPPVIHFIWLGPRAFPPESVENVRTWMGKNPGWTVKFWTDRERELPCEGMEKVFVKDFTFLRLGKCYEQSENWGEKSDLLRYEILFQEGGVYVDHDTYCLRSFNGMNRGYDFFCCLEPPHEAFVGRNVTCGNAVLGSRARHPTFQRVIELVAERWEALGLKFRGRDDYSRIEVVMQRTYIPLTNVIGDALDQNGNVDIVLPAAYFLPKSGMKALYAKHFFSTTWNEFKDRKSGFDHSKEKSLSKLRQKNKNLSFLIIGLIALNGILGCIVIIKGKRE